MRGTRHGLTSTSVSHGPAQARARVKIKSGAMTTPTAPDEDQGIVLGDRYRLGEVLGHGGMADVHRALDLLLDREVAVKVLRETVDDHDRDRFMHEARTLAGLSHVNLVTVLDAGTSAERPYLVMELIHGRTLAEALRGGPRPPAEVADVGTQLADALGYAHTRGVVHRDVKPANVLVDRDGRVKLADFGIAKLLGETVKHTQTGTVIGTAAYLSPEQVQGQSVDGATDVYSLGLVLLEALTAVRAFPGPPTEAALARLHRTPDIPAELSPGWRDLLTDMLALDPATRPNADTVRQRLSVLADPDATVPPPVTTRHGGATTTRVLPAAGAPSTATGAQTTEPPPIDRMGEAISHRVVDGWQRMRGLPEHHKAVAIAVLLLVILLVVAAWAANQPEASSEVPAETPRELRQPLRDLHDAVNGR